jgi:hypothetical protein
MRITRADKSILSDWWFTVDRLMFFGLLLLMGTGLILSLAASPPIADKFHLEPFYFVRRQAAMLLPAVVIMFGEADPPRQPDHLRRRHRPDGADHAGRARDQGRQALASDRLRLPPAVGIREARLHRAHRVAVQ